MDTGMYALDLQDPLIGCTSLGSLEYIGIYKEPRIRVAVRSVEFCGIRSFNS